MAYTDILYDVTDGIATITFNRPEKMNAARKHTHQDLLAALNEGLSAAEHAMITMTLGYAPDEPEYAWALRELTDRAS